METTDIQEYQILDKNALQNINLCKNCNKPLNIPPIYGLEYPGGLVNITCGRCYNVVHKHNGKKWKQQAYENIAQHMSYPCSYKKQGCKVIMKWNEIVEHESNCKYLIFNCPTNENEFYNGFSCPWQGSTDLLLNHIQEEHQIFFANPPYFEELPLTSGVYFTDACNTIFMIVFLKEDDNNYSFCVFVRGGELTAQMYRYQIELSNSSKTNSIILRKNKVENWFNVESTLCNKTALLKIDCSIIEDLIMHTSTDKRISARIGIVKKNRKEIKQIYEAAGRVFSDTEYTIPHKIKNDADENLLTELECPVCNEYMVPPIYICSNGHSLCNDCIVKVQTCPNCRCALGNTRNFTLENLTTKVLYHCRNKEAGCRFTTTSVNIREHESSCNLTTIPCLLECGQTFKKAHLWPHFISKHKESILESGEIHKRNIDNKKENHYMFFACDEIFRFSIKGHFLQNYKFNIQLIASTEEKPRFKYTLEIIDKSPYKLNITIINLVHPFGNKTLPVKQNSVVIPWEMVKPFVLSNSRHFYFKYNISPLETV